MANIRPVPIEEFGKALQKAVCEGQSLRNEKAIESDEMLHAYIQELKQKIHNKKE